MTKKRILLIALLFLIALAQSSLGVVVCVAGSANVVCGACGGATPVCNGYCDSYGSTVYCSSASAACNSNGACVECMVNTQCSNGYICSSNTCILANPAVCGASGQSSCPGNNIEVTRASTTIKNPSGTTCATSTSIVSGDPISGSVSGSSANGGACCNVEGQYYVIFETRNGISTLDSRIYASAYYLTAAETCVCGNGVCQAGENCPSCPADCPGYNTNNYCNGGFAYGCGYLPITNPAGKGIQVNNCGQAGTTGQYCDTYAQRPVPNTYWTASSTFTTNSGAILCAAGVGTTCSVANMCMAQSGYYCSPSSTWTTTNPIISGSLACQSGTKYTCTAANTCQQAGTTGYYCDTDGNWIAQSRFTRGSTICYDGTKYIANATITVKATNDTSNIDQVRIDVVDDAVKTNLLGTNTTNGAGIAGFNMSEKSNYPYRLVSIIASRPDLGLSITERFPLYYNKDNNITIKMRTANECLPDCTRNDDDYHLCDPGCNGINGCSYYDVQSMNACTIPRQARGARRVIEDNPINQTAVYCCAGIPIVEKKNTNISVSCAGGEAIKMTKIVIVDGEPVKMNVIACSDKK